jgi:hypothetical protein
MTMSSNDSGKAPLFFLVVEGSGRCFAFPAGQVLLVTEWRAPYSLPLSAPWLVGWLPYEGRALPVVAPDPLLPSAQGPSLLVLLDGEDHRFFFPGESGQFVRGTLLVPPTGSPLHVVGQLDCGRESSVEVLDAALLYRSFHLGYNPPLDG